MKLQLRPVCKDLEAETINASALMEAKDLREITKVPVMCEGLSTDIIIVLD